jgi:multimeric flavodoxin WrbA
MTTSWDFSDLTALWINCSLKRSTERSHTQALMDVGMGVMQAHGVTLDVQRAADLGLPAGVQPDMRDHGEESDDWPELFERVLAADILVIGTPIWLGQKASVCSRVIERLYGNSGQLNARGQWTYYGRVGGCIVTGNEDGAKHCAMEVLYSLQHLGYAIPPQADACWLGEAGPGPSYSDPGAGGPQNEFTQRNTVFAAWNLMHLGAALKRAGGFPARGNQRAEWDAGANFDHPNPEYR